jgi:hypothetical protein
VRDGIDAKDCDAKKKEAGRFAGRVLLQFDMTPQMFIRTMKNLLVTSITWLTSQVCADNYKWLKEAHQKLEIL